MPRERAPFPSARGPLIAVGGAGRRRYGYTDAMRWTVGHLRAGGLLSVVARGAAGFALPAAVRARGGRAGPHP